MALITMEEIEGLSPMFKGEKGHARAKRVMRMLGIDQLAERYGRHEDLSGPDFVDAFLKDLNVNYEVGGMEHLVALVQGPFITVSNHPYKRLPIDKWKDNGASTREIVLKEFLRKLLL